MRFSYKYDMTNRISSIPVHVPPEQATDVLMNVDRELDDKIENVARRTHQEREEVIRQSLERGLDTLIARSASS